MDRSSKVDPNLNLSYARDTDTFVDLLKDGPLLKLAEFIVTLNKRFFPSRDREREIRPPEGVIPEADYSCYL